MTRFLASQAEYVKSFKEIYEVKIRQALKDENVRETRISVPIFISSVECISNKKLKHTRSVLFINVLEKHRLENGKFHPVAFFGRELRGNCGK